MSGGNASLGPHAPRSVPRDMPRAPMGPRAVPWGLCLGTPGPGPNSPRSVPRAAELGLKRAQPAPLPGDGAAVGAASRGSASRSSAEAGRPEPHETVVAAEAGRWVVPVAVVWLLCRGRGRAVGPGGRLRRWWPGMGGCAGDTSPECRGLGSGSCTETGAFEKSGIPRHRHGCSSVNELATVGRW